MTRETLEDKKRILDEIREQSNASLTHDNETRLKLDTLFCFVMAIVFMVIALVTAFAEDQTHSFVSGTLCSIWAVGGMVLNNIGRLHR